MRGDSLRDLYAKALAILGLGVLAGLGALVDYWPTRDQMPRVDGLPTGPLAAAAHPVRPVTIEIPDLRAPAVVSRPAVRRAPRPANATPTALVPVSAMGVATVAAIPALAAAGVETTFDAPPLQPIPTVATVAPAATRAIALSELPVEDRESVRYLAAAVATPEEDEGGFFSGATGLARKAGSSILATGSKAGASIVEGLSFVGRGLKKLKFF